MNTRNNPDSDENAAMTLDNQRAVFAAQKMAEPTPEQARALLAISATKTPRSDQFTGLVAAMPHVGAMFDEMVKMELELSEANADLASYAATSKSEEMDAMAGNCKTLIEQNARLLNERNLLRGEIEAVRTGIINAEAPTGDCSDVLDLLQVFIQHHKAVEGERDAIRVRFAEADADNLKASGELAAAQNEIAYLKWRLKTVIPLLQEARDALPAITTVQAQLRGISLSLAERMDAAGTATRADFNAIQNHPKLAL